MDTPVPATTATPSTIMQFVTKTEDEVNAIIASPVLKDLAEILSLALPVLGASEAAVVGPLLAVLENAQTLLSDVEKFASDVSTAVVGHVTAAQAK